MIGGGMASNPMAGLGPQGSSTITLPFGSQQSQPGSSQLMMNGNYNPQNQFGTRSNSYYQGQRYMNGAPG